jgi:hypothetical protein
MMGILRINCVLNARANMVKAYGVFIERSPVGDMGILILVPLLSLVDWRI